MLGSCFLDGGGGGGGRAPARGTTQHTDPHHRHGPGSTPQKQTHTYTPARERAPPEPHAPKHSIQERVPPVSYHHMLLVQASSNQMLTAKRGACAGLTS